MSASTETLAVLAEISSPTIVAPADVRAAILAWVESGAKIGQQAHLTTRLLQSANLMEGDAELHGLFEPGFQSLAALVREAEAADQALRRVAAVLRQVATWGELVQARVDAIAD